MTALTGLELPAIQTDIPGPSSIAWADRLRDVESRNITFLSHRFPVFWEKARGAVVADVDGNRFLDLSGAFGVAAVGHAHPKVVSAACSQVEVLPHGMGDVHPTPVKVRLLERLAELSPGDLGYGVLGSSGADAVEAAIKTARLATGREGIVAFEGGYHGLTLGALRATHDPRFREPFGIGMADSTHFLPYPRKESEVSGVIDQLLSLVKDTVGLVLAEPLLGRGGCQEPAPGFLTALREVCDGSQALLALDEIYTGFGRTGTLFACEHEGVVPDLLLLGKAMTGGFPLSVCLGRTAVMEAWPVSEGEAVHTQTFLGHPVGCRAALAAIEVLLEEGLAERAVGMGDRFRRQLGDAFTVRGRGLFLGLLPPAGISAVELTVRALERGLILLPCGPGGSVLSITPPLVITESQIDHAALTLRELVDAS
ncbi:MAG: aspartate aminotransferase family protein [Planctomycetota bacterium]|nr:aspartate aminotransferase family protein [Planctomycetota bacterium]